ncbi:MAG TPA: 1-acyl-sn-glycerol-3-phosphate acyltransferase [Chitinophagaceae bacterium]|nr:1-acyl-sn-glycerol-3-phosphate acyltransferase [Chitinophagaceae bacterium]
MLYKILKPVVRLAMLIFCRRIIINKPELLKRKGPLLLACNHPNSFLDAAILADLFKHPVYSLTRGDVFKKPFYRKLLTALKMFPVYRTSEGSENININYETFTICRKIFEQKGIVLIFSEGRCINEWHLRPLMKGTARLAFSSWDENIPLEVLPVGMNYSSFRRFGKNLFINFGEIISQKDFDLNESDGKKFQAFNQKLQEQLQQLVFEIDKKDISKQKQLLEKKASPISKIILFIPAAIGFLIHAPIFIPIKNFVRKRTRNNDHYDSIVVALLLFFYPIYLILLTIIAILLTGNFYFLLLIFALPFTAWACVQLKPQLDKRI